MTNQPYRPSNQEEGESFYRKWCAECAHEDLHPYYGTSQCGIINLSEMLDEDDEAYPYELQWVDGTPVCTAFSLRGDSMYEDNYRGMIEDDYRGMSGDDDLDDVCY